MDLPTRKQKRRSLIDALLWITLGIFAIVALFILAPLLVSGGHKQTTSGGYIGSLEMDPTMVAVMETIAAGQSTQIAQSETQVALLEGIQPTATATPKSTATRNPTPQVPDCDIANVGDLCRVPPYRETVIPKPTSTPYLDCTLVTPSTYGPTLCIKD
jgi:hypothetical protein